MCVWFSHHHEHTTSNSLQNSECEHTTLDSQQNSEINQSISDSNTSESPPRNDIQPHTHVDGRNENGISREEKVKDIVDFVLEYYKVKLASEDFSYTDDADIMDEAEMNRNIDQEELDQLEEQEQATSDKKKPPLHISLTKKVCIILISIP